MSRALKYVSRLSKNVKNYGLIIVIKKIVIDLLLYLGLERFVPKRIRWLIAHDFHAAWKFSQEKIYGTKEYNRRIDKVSKDKLINFYEVGLDFSGKVFVDVGCGTRGLLYVIKAKMKFGVDPVIEKVKDNFVFIDDVIWLSDKAENIGINDSVADIVSCNNTLNHVEDPQKAIDEIYRILKPGGLFLLEVFIEKKNIAHPHCLDVDAIEDLVLGHFKPKMMKYERLNHGVEIMDHMDGLFPMRYGGVFQK